MSHARFIIGDTRDVVASLPDHSVDLVLTSPPFLALRSYLPSDHPDKHREIGSEATPAEFLQVLLELAAEWRRVLALHGSIAIELGDTYAGSGGAGGDYGADRASNDPGWPMDKSLCGLPHLFHLSLAYGVNLLTGEPSPAGQWRVRNVIAWTRPNPPVGALGDKFRPATSYMTIATPYRDRYFDLEATRTPPKYATPGTRRNGPGGMPLDDAGRPAADGSQHLDCSPGGAPPLDWWVPLEEEQALWDAWADELWKIPTALYRGSHYATWPPALCVRPIEAMVPHRVCTTCGKPSRRLVEKSPEYAEHMAAQEGRTLPPVGERLNRLETTQARRDADYVTVGWSDCGHDTWRNGVALDPFAGSGTTLAVATGHGRDAIGIDIDSRNAALALERVGGLFLSVEVHEPPSTEESA